MPDPISDLKLDPDSSGGPLATILYRHVVATPWGPVHVILHHCISGSDPGGTYYFSLIHIVDGVEIARNSGVFRVDAVAQEGATRLSCMKALEAPDA